MNNQREQPQCVCRIPLINRTIIYVNMQHLLCCKNIICQFVLLFFVLFTLLCVHLAHHYYLLDHIASTVSIFFAIKTLIRLPVAQDLNKITELVDYSHAALIWQNALSVKSKIFGKRHFKFEALPDSRNFTCTFNFFIQRCMNQFL